MRSEETIGHTVRDKYERTSLSQKSKISALIYVVDVLKQKNMFLLNNELMIDY